MTPTELAIIERALDSDAITEDEAVSVTEALGALRRRDWAVRVHDAYSDQSAYHYTEITPGKGGFFCTVFEPCSGGAEETSHEWADTREATRAAVAVALYPTLPADVRADLGECP